MTAATSPTWHLMAPEVRHALEADPARCPLCHYHVNRQGHTPTCPNRARCQALHSGLGRCACSGYVPDPGRSPDWDKCALCGHTEQMHRPEAVGS